MVWSGSMSGMAIPSPSPRRVKSPSWLDGRLVVGVILVIGSLLVGAKVVASARHSDRVLAATRDLAAGTVLTDADVVLVSVRLPDHGRALYLAGAASVAGQALNRPLARGELVPAQALGVTAPTTTIMVPIDDGQAPGLRGSRPRCARRSCSSVT
jgi:flagella basal body P-ring formation protein FlgA